MNGATASIRTPECPAPAHWHGRQWNWESWDGTGQHDRGTANKRGDAFARASQSVDEMSKERGVPREKLYDASIERGTKLRTSTEIEQAPTPEQRPNVIIEPTQLIQPATTDQPGLHVAESADEKVDQSIVDSLKAAGSSHVRPLREVIGNDPETTEGYERPIPKPTSTTDWAKTESAPSKREPGHKSLLSECDGGGVRR